MSDIEWCDLTWNPIIGCSRVSDGCTNCYAERFVHRELAPQHRGLTVLGKGTKGPRWTGEVRLVENALAKPLSWKKPRRVFVNSLSDLWHEAVPHETVAAIFGVMAATPHITYQILTKRPARMRVWFDWIARKQTFAASGTEAQFCRYVASAHLRDDDAWRRVTAPWPLPNVWLGVTAEDQQRADERIPMLFDTPAALRFVSYEPALGPARFTPWLPSPLARQRHQLVVLRGDTATAEAMTRVFRVGRPCIDWLIVGGESGPGARPLDLAWARSAVAQCREAGVPVFVKQLGARPEHKERQPVRLRHRKGADPSEWPEELRVREFPRPRPR